MNNAQRKELRSLIEDAQRARATLEELNMAIANIKDQEQEKFDNMPEGLQQSDQGQAIEECAQAMDEQCDNIESAISDIDSALSELEQLL